MVFKVNYRQQRSERNRVKQNKKDAKLHAREEAAAGSWRDLLSPRARVALSSGQRNRSTD